MNIDEKRIGRTAKTKLVGRWAAAGFTIAALICTYAQLTDSSPPRTFSPLLWAIFIIACPPALLSVPLIDVEPGSAGFFAMWAVIGVANGLFYGLIGLIISRSRRTKRDKLASTNSDSSIIVP